MNKDEIVKRARKFFTGINIELEPGEIGEEKDGKVEVIFLRSAALEPGAIIDPPDVRVWVDTRTGEVTKIHQL